MLSLTKSGIQDKKAWEEAGIKLPAFNQEEMIKATEANPRWVHFGAGNIFRGFTAASHQKLLNAGQVKEGIIAVDTFDEELIDKIYTAYDNLTLLVKMHPDGKLDKEVIGSIAKALKGNPAHSDYEQLKEIFKNPSLQMASFTITEKGYNVGDTVPSGHIMAIVTDLLYARYQAGAYKMALVSMDNCSHNGQRLQDSILKIANIWLQEGKVEKGFIDYLQDESTIAFPWSMIDKITPRPSEEVQRKLEEEGLTEMEPIITNKNTYTAPFVNAEVPEYLVVEDCFPNGRPPLENAGVYFTDRETVNQSETMKVTTCLNPLHTALAVYGCLLGHTSIAKEMQDTELKKLVMKIGYEEGLPVVIRPKILDPKAFIDEVIEQRLPNPYIPDTPQRIATDTSQKVGIRFGETIKAYQRSESLDAKELTYIPLAIAGWLRYLLGVDDNNKSFERSGDPLLEELTSLLQGIRVGEPSSYTNQLKPILSNETLFGVDLYGVGLAQKIETMFKEMIIGENAVRNTLIHYLG